MKKISTLLKEIIRIDGWHSLGNGVEYCKNCNTVYVKCYLTGGKTIGTNYQIIASLPSDCCPSKTLYLPAGTGVQYVGTVYIDNNGNIGAKTNTGTSSSIWFNIAFPVGGGSQ